MNVSDDDRRKHREAEKMLREVGLSSLRFASSLLISFRF